MTRSRFHPNPSLAVVLVAATACADRGPEASPPPESTSSPRGLADAAAAVAGDGLVERFVSATGVFLGVPYENGPLGEGELGGPDPDPRFDLSRVDCVTYLEQSLALALAGDDEPRFLRTLDAVRYRGAEVSFPARNHYMVTDWIPANDWILRDVTASVAPGLTKTVTRTIDRAEFLRGHGVEPRPGADDPREVTIEIVPTAALARVAPALRSGDLVFWVGRREGIFVVHTGLAVRDATGRLLFRHGSSKAGRVLDEPFAEYAERAGFADGFVVLRLRDDARPGEESP